MGLVMREQDEAFSGLEAAIIVIALVIVAVIFGMGMIGTGFIATEKSQDVTTSSYKQASSTLYIEGAIYATLDAGTNALDKVSFSAAVPETGQPQDLSGLTIVYTHSKDPTTFRTYAYGGTTADPAHFGTDHGPTMNPGDKQTFRLAQVNGPIPGGWFTIELKPKMGASTFVTYHLSDTFKGGSVLT